MISKLLPTRIGVISSFVSGKRVKPYWVILLALSATACVDGDADFDPVSGTAFETSSATIQVRGLDKASTVCYTTNGADPIWNSGACGSVGTTRVSDPSSAFSVNLSCGADTGEMVQRTLRLNYDWVGGVVKSATALYYLNCATDTTGPVPTDPIDPGDGGNATNNSLGPNEQIVNNEYLESNNAKYRLYLQTDGNVVLRNWETRAALWSTKTHGQGGVRLRFQGDGNLVLRSSSGSALWSSSTAGQGGTRLVLNDDGSLVIYAGTRAVWTAQ